eukprot:COSAG02_NODE_5594_length_4201_cov_51.406047_2_plen_75_part_01
MDSCSSWSVVCSAERELPSLPRRYCSDSHSCPSTAVTVYCVTVLVHQYSAILDTIVQLFLRVIGEYGRMSFALPE